MATPAGGRARARTERSDGTGGREERVRRPAPKCGGGSIGSTRPVGLEDLEGWAPGFARSTLPSRTSEPVKGGRRAPPAPAPSPTLPGGGRRARPRSGRTPA
eukprot:6191908-Pleurochrysis_carterae.AAC.1